MAVTTSLPTLYEHYTAGGISSGLSVDKPYFTLNDKNITIFSGAMHYFRIPRQYWRDRLRKLRAAGLNTVETYVPWNLHEPENGVFDFGNGGTEMEEFLDLQEYLKIAQEEDLFAIVRSGPYICAEWEWGGFPSWLLKEDSIGIRSSENIFMTYVKRYFSVLLPLLAALQFMNGGPIIAFGVENEYGNAPYHDKVYLQQLYDTMKDNGIKELLFTADNVRAGTTGALPGVLFQTANFAADPDNAFGKLLEMQPGQPLMAMEFYPGWFDNWSEKHQTLNTKTFRERYESILKYPGSVNLYMFHGGTNWGFLNGASISIDNSDFQPITTSYDYDAPLTEAGDYTEKYDVIKELMKQYNTLETLIPEPPEPIIRKAYPTLNIDGQLSYNDVIENAPMVLSNKTPLPMEHIGQSYGYIVYRKEGLDIAANSVLTIEGHLHDRLLLLINGNLISKTLASVSDFDGFGYWKLDNSSITLSSTDLKDATLDLVVENWGRGNHGQMYHQFKGLTEDNQVYLNDEELFSWTIIPYEFKKEWTTSLTGWKSVEGDLKTGPALYRSVLSLDEDPTDTFINMQEWTKGIVIVNGFVLGRYTFLGPQQTLYLPGPFLQKGDNEIIIFEEFNAVKEIKFSENSIFNIPSTN